MNEQSQLDAIKSELRARGYVVEQDVDASRIDPILEEDREAFREIAGIGDVDDRGDASPLLLDLLATLPEAARPSTAQPRQIVIEIANRTRHGRTKDRSTIFGARLPIEDYEAVERFDMISAMVAENEDIYFEIRFFDVSADQANARHLKSRWLRNRIAIVDALNEDRTRLSALSEASDFLRALLVARLWSRWLRIVGHLHPARKHRELKSADLRTLQKDLYDYQVLTIPPYVYRQVHRQIIAVNEGGDISIRSLLHLEPQLHKLHDWVFSYYKMDKSSPAERSSILSDFEREIAERAPADRVQGLQAALSSLSLSVNSTDFARNLARLQVQMGADKIVSEETMQKLLRRAAEL